MVKSAPQDQKSLKLDVAKVGAVNIHQVVPDANQPLDENAKRLFGENPNIYFAIRDDAILLARRPGRPGGPQGAPWRPSRRRRRRCRWKCR